MMRKTSCRILFPLCLLLGSLHAGSEAGLTQPLQQQGSPANAAGPEGIRWRLAELGGKPVSLPARGNQHNLLLDPAQKRVSGISGCNTFTATYAIEGAALKFGPVAATRRACPEAEAAEAELLKVLERTRGWRITDGALLLLNASEVLARFTREREETGGAGLESITVRSTVVPAGNLVLSRGEYSKPAAPGSASEISVRLSDKRAFGTVRGSQMCAVVLVSSTGGTGTYSELALLARRADGWVNTDTVLLGDRVNVRSVTMQGDAIVVAMATHGPQDPMCCPTLEVTKRFSVRGSRLAAAEPAKTSADPQIIATVWQWMQTLSNDDKRTVPPKPENYTVRFLESGKLEVKADCNLKGGTYSLEARRLSISITHSTMAACEEGSLEERFVGDLTAAVGFFLKDGNLYIDLKYDSGTMRFAKRP